MYMEALFVTMTGKELVARLKKDGWSVDRIQGSHHILIKSGHHPVSVPVHANKDIPTGTLNHLLKVTGLKGK